MPNPITLQLSLDDYNAMQSAKTKAEQETAEVCKELEAAKFVDGDERVAKVTAFAREALTVARFAVANLPPEMIRSWPYQALFKIAETINDLPDCSINDRDMAIDLAAFARDCEAHEIRRRAEPRPTRMTPADVEEQRARIENDPAGKALMQAMQMKTNP
jgi:hypothetical protein